VNVCRGRVTNSAGPDRITQQLNGLALRMLVKQRQKCVADRRTPRRRLLQRLLHRSLMAGWYCNPSLPQHHVSHEPRTVTMAIIAMKSITSDSSSRKRARRRPGPYRWLRPHHPDSRPRHYASNRSPVTETVHSNAQETNHPGNFREPCRCCTQTARETTVPVTQAVAMKQIMNYPGELPA